MTPERIERAAAKRERCPGSGEPFLGPQRYAQNKGKVYRLIVPHRCHRCQRMIGTRWNCTFYVHARPAKKRGK